MKFRLNSKLLNLFILDISRAFSAAHVSTLTLHQSVRDVVSDIVTDDDDDDGVDGDNEEEEEDEEDDVDDNGDDDDDDAAHVSTLTASKCVAGMW